MTRRINDMPCAKWAVFAINLLTCLASVAIIITGCVLYFDDTQDSFDRIELIHVIGLATVSVVFLVSLFGLCGSVLRSPILILIYIIVLGVILLLQTGIFPFISFKQSEVTNKFNNNTFNHEDFQDLPVDFVQEKMKCCGINGPEDWVFSLNSTKIPNSCCPHFEDGTCNFLRSYKLGCKRAFLDFFEEYAWIIIGMTIFITFIELVLFGLSCALYGVFGVRVN